MGQVGRNLWRHCVPIPRGGRDRLLMPSCSRFMEEGVIRKLTALKYAKVEAKKWQ